MRFSTLTAVCAVALATSQVVTATTDVDTLNYALTLEYLEADYYNQGLTKFDQAAFASYFSTNFPNAGIDASVVYANLQLIQGHENAHVAYLQKVITSLQGTVASKCPSYNFTQYLTDVGTFVGSGYSFESLGVQAYDGALNSLTSPTLQQGAATIATIEARHATYLQQFAATDNYLHATGGSAADGNAFDNAANSSYVASQVGGLLVGGTCGQLTLPLPRTLNVNYTSYYVAGTSNTLAQNDVNALNYALFLENFEAAFYKNYNGIFTASDFSNAKLPADTQARLALIQQHEAAHVTFLNTALTAAKATPKAACSSYTFPTMNLTTFIATAAAIEAAGVSAYDGAINSITNPGYAQAAATIATVEARHADYLAQIAGNAQFSADNGQNNGQGGAFDSPRSPSDTATLVQSLNMIPSSCFSDITLPATAGTTSSTPTTKNAAGKMAVNYGTVIAAGVVAAAAIMA